MLGAVISLGELCIIVVSEWVLIAWSFEVVSYKEVVVGQGGDGLIR